MPVIQGIPPVRGRRGRPRRRPDTVDPDVVPTHGDVIVNEGSGDEVLRGEDVVAHKPVSTNCPPPLRPGPASSCLVTAIGRNETTRQGVDARLATLTPLAKAGQASS
jgi:hypothetical protein